MVSDLDTEGFIFNQAPEKLWYNWANSKGNTYIGISYSAGTTWIFNNSEPPKVPEILIYSKEQINNVNQAEPLYKTILDSKLIPNSQGRIQGIRSLLMVDDDQSNPYLLIGTFSYPIPGIPVSCKLIKWDFVNNLFSILFTIENSNSIRTIRRYQNYKSDYIMFSTQNDGNSQTPSQIFYVKEKKVKKLSNIECEVNLVSFIYNKNMLYGSVWDFSIDKDYMYISIPKRELDETKLSGFRILARLFYCKIEDFLNKNKTYNYTVKLNSIIGNELYPDGFDINYISTVQVETNAQTDKVYIYTLSDFLYQIQEQGFNQIIKNKFPDINSISTVLELIKSIQELLLNLDVAGTRILSFNKVDLEKKYPPILKTVVGNPLLNTIVKSNTTNGYNNYLNVYTWASTSEKELFYFGTLDIRDILYKGLVDVIVNILGDPSIKPQLLALPEETIILITELLNVNLCLPIDFANTQLYFDVIQIDNGNISKITSNGFNNTGYLSETSDSGVRNLEIVTNSTGKYLTIGTTAYQQSNSAKVYVIKI